MFYYAFYHGFKPEVRFTQEPVQCVTVAAKIVMKVILHSESLGGNCESNHLPRLRNTDLFPLCIMLHVLSWTKREVQYLYNRN